MKSTVLIKNAIKCKKCGDIIESKYTHNFVICSCGACSVDGGLDYLRRCGNLVDWEDLSEYEEVEVTPKYKVGDKVIFKYVFDFNTVVGVVQVVDTFPNSTIVDYDILNEQEPCLYKHVNEKDVIGKYED